MKKLITASILVIGTTCAAYAADLGPAYKAPRPAPPPPPSWTGCYVDGGGGYGMWNQDNFSKNGSVPITDTQTTGGRGWFGQVGGGCDYQFPVAGWGNFLVGVLADYSFMNLHGQFDEQFSGDSGREKESGAWAVGARLGYLATPNLLTYINGGWTETRFDQINLGAFQTAIPTGAFLPATTYNGWFIGGGTETSLAGWFPSLPSGLYLRSEYRFSTFSSKDVTFGGTGIGGVTGVHATKYVQTIGTALVWKFWSP
jgi:outer membrane immunogenic protein